MIHANEYRPATVHLFCYFSDTVGTGHLEVHDLLLHWSLRGDRHDSQLVSRLKTFGLDQIQGPSQKQFKPCEEVIEVRKHFGLESTES